MLYSTKNTKFYMGLKLLIPHLKFSVLNVSFHFAECDSCVHLLLDDVEVMDHSITTISKDLDSVSVGVGAIRRLERINNTVIQLRVNITFLQLRL